MTPTPETANEAAVKCVQGLNIAYDAPSWMLEDLFKMGVSWKAARDAEQKCAYTDECSEGFDEKEAQLREQVRVLESENATLKRIVFGGRICACASGTDGIRHICSDCRFLQALQAAEKGERG